jgi:hypothetical protein
MTKKQKYEREKKIANAIRLAWESLESHLTDIYDPTYPQVKERKAKNHIGDWAFHVQCVKDYAQIISALVDEL